LILLSKCANPICFARFHSLRHGKLFRVERKPVADPVQTTYHVEYFWLCENCARVMTIVWNNGLMKTRPLHLALTAGAGK
jgi:hypothetical protein